VLRAGGVASFGRDRGHLHLRPGRRHQRRPDQDRGAGAVGADRQVQPVASHRRGPRRRRPLRRVGCVPEAGMKLRRAAVGLFAVALLVVGVAVLTNVLPYRQIVDQQRQVEAAAAELEALQEENELLTARRDALQTPVEIERLAREKLGYVRPGEVAYVVLDPPTAPTTTVPTTSDPDPIEDDTLWGELWDFVTGADLKQ